MRLATIRTGRRGDGVAQLAAGVVFDDEVALLPPEVGDVDALIRGGSEALEAARRAVDDAPRRPLAELDLAAPLQRFNRDVLCTGWNYWDHFDESYGLREGQDPEGRPNHPTFFTKGPNAVIGPHDDVPFDPELSKKWDYEAELALVIGRDGRSIPEERALDHVAGYVVANDISQRDLQRAHGGQWLKGKSIDGTLPLGPWVTTPDEVEDPHALTISCEINGEELQHASTRQMAFSMAQLIAEVSWGMTLRAGDVLLTGTPSGIGNARDPQVFLSDGDEIVTRVEGLGELRNRVVRTSLTDPAP